MCVFGGRVSGFGEGMEESDIMLLGPGAAEDGNWNFSFN